MTGVTDYEKRFICPKRFPGAIITLFLVYLSAKKRLFHFLSFCFLVPPSHGNSSYLDGLVANSQSDFCYMAGGDVTG